MNASASGNAIGRVHVTFDLPVRAGLALQSSGLEVSTPGDFPNASLEHHVHGAAAIICLLGDRIDEAVMACAGDSLRIVANFAAGYDNIDLESARKRGITVSNTPGVVDGATADLAIALLLACARRVVEADRFVREKNDWTWKPDFFTGLDVSCGSTLGIIGLGRVGKAVARRAAAFDMTIVATGGRLTREEATDVGVELLPPRELLEISDVVSVHCPLTPSTWHLLGASEFQIMKRSAILINTARGPIVDELALVRALQTGEIGGAGLDVFEWEPAITQQLTEMSNVIMTPHIASAGRETRERMGLTAVENVIAVLSGLPALTAVN